MRKPNLSINSLPKSLQVFAPFRTACVSVCYKRQKKSVTNSHISSVFLFLPRVSGTTLNPWTLKNFSNCCCVRKIFGVCVSIIKSAHKFMTCVIDRLCTYSNACSRFSKVFISIQKLKSETNVENNFGIVKKFSILSQYKTDFDFGLDERWNFGFFSKIWEKNRSGSKNPTPPKNPKTFPD